MKINQRKIKYMKKNLTHIVFIVDRSGSMTSIANDMIGGYNTFIKNQKELPAECFVSFYQFDDVYEAVFERVKLQDVKLLDDKTYVPRGFTALYDAVGKTIINYGKYLSDLPDSERPERVLVVTITDGLNNASKEHNSDTVRYLVKMQTDTYKWDFVFLGSNIDAWEAGSSIGIKSSSTIQWSNNSGSVASAFCSLASSTRNYRSSRDKSDHSFSDADVAAQSQHLTGDLKAKNDAQANAHMKNKP